MQVALRKSDDICAAALARGRDAIPDGGRLVRAAFDFYSIRRYNPELNERTRDRSVSRCVEWGHDHNS